MLSELVLGLYDGMPPTHHLTDAGAYGDRPAPCWPTRWQVYRCAGTCVDHRRVRFRQAEHDWIRLGLLHAPPATGSPLQRCRSLLRDVVTVAASTGTGTLWRGQASIDWRLVPSIARRKLPAENRSQAVLDWTSKTLAEAEAAAGRWRDGIHYRGLHPIEKLAHLRHHGVPSPLIDVTPDPFVALWFASDPRPDKSGILIGLNTHREQVSELRAVVDSYLCWRQLEGRPARNESVAGLGWALGSAEQESRIYAMDPPVLNDRIVVQRSRFLLSWFPPLASIERRCSPTSED